jgi:hypothetical protein
VNKKMLKKMLWRQCILRPHVQSVFEDEGFILIRDWPWQLTGLEDRALHLQNTVTGHILPLPNEYFRAYRENVRGRHPFLELRAQVYINRVDAWIEPLTRLPEQSASGFA